LWENLLFATPRAARGSGEFWGVDTTARRFLNSQLDEPNEKQIETQPIPHFHHTYHHLPRHVGRWHVKRCQSHLDWWGE
jgi:hypothetical protein